MMVARNILLVEDNVADQKLAIRGLKEAGVQFNVNTVSDGEEAIAYLTGTGRHVGAVRPSLVILDLNLPKRDGREVLTYIRKSDSLRNIPVVVLTTSDSQEDIEEAYTLGANSYFTKLPEIDRFFTMMDQMTRYWFSWAKLPGKIAGSA